LALPSSTPISVSCGQSEFYYKKKVPDFLFYWGTYNNSAEQSLLRI